MQTLKLIAGLLFIIAIGWFIVILMQAIISAGVQGFDIFSLISFIVLNIPAALVFLIGLHLWKKEQNN